MEKSALRLENFLMDESLLIGEESHGEITGLEDCSQTFTFLETKEKKKTH